MPQHLISALAGLVGSGVIAATYVLGVQQGTDSGHNDNRVTITDVKAYDNCQAHYHNTNQCYQDVFASWQR